MFLSVYVGVRDLKVQAFEVGLDAAVQTSFLRTDVGAQTTAVIDTGVGEFDGIQVKHILTDAQIQVANAALELCGTLLRCIRHPASDARALSHTCDIHQPSISDIGGQICDHHLEDTIIGRRFADIRDAFTRLHLRQVTLLGSPA